MVVEAVFEKFDLKKEIFQKLDALCPPDVILASNA
jgi:3-hydroxyacyl-CoA dehydrogenase